MTMKMIKINDDNLQELEKFIASSNGNIELVEDENLKLDPYFYERKASLDKTIEAVEDGSMKMYSEEEWNIEMDNFMIQLENEYENNKN